jgi:hypothetical protein
MAARCTTRLQAGWFLLLVSVLLPAVSVAADKAGASDPAAGSRLYFEGLLPSGQPVQATVTGDVPVSGDQLACVSCHRRSRLGTSEAGRQVSPVTADALFGPGANSKVKGVLPKAFARIASNRPAYDDRSLARAIRDGVNSAGTALAPSMPRYALSETEMAALIAFLREQPAGPPPGVTETDLHFATVVTEDAPKDQRDLVVGMLEAYFKDKNSTTRHETKRAQFSAYKMYQVYRKWQLHVWQLRGPSSTWPAQLERYHKSQPVLALISGLSTQSWRPVHRFCEERQVACLFPNTSLPTVADGDFYSVYYTRGLTLEAQTIAKFLQDNPDPARKVVQIYRDSETGTVAAEAFRAKAAGIAVEDLRLPAGQGLTPALLAKFGDPARPPTLLLWLKPEDLTGLPDLAKAYPQIPAIFLAAGLAGESLPESWAALNNRLYLTYPWELPERRQSRSVKAKTWLQAKHIPLTHERLQIDTFFAVTLLGESVKAILDNFSSAYLLERIEDMVGTLTPSTYYPRLSLGAGQRFASKGCYLVRPAAAGKLVVAGGWIVP